MTVTLDQIIAEIIGAKPDEVYKDGELLTLSFALLQRSSSRVVVLVVSGAPTQEARQVFE